jgi:hypothetical protein
MISTFVFERLYRSVKLFVLMTVRFVQHYRTSLLIGKGTYRTCTIIKPVLNFGRNTFIRKVIHKSILKATRCIVPVQLFVVAASVASFQFLLLCISGT